MSLDTKVTYADPQITITVDDDGGGDNKHKVDVHVSWDPKLIKYKNYLKPKSRHKLDKKNGTCSWYRQSVPGTGKEFEISLESTGKGDGYVCAVAVDKYKGQVKGHVYIVVSKKQTRKKPKKKPRRSK